MCSIFNVKSVIGISAGIVSVLFGLVISQSEITARVQNFIFELPPISIALVLFLLILSALFIGFIAIKNFKFERLVKMYEA